MEHEGNIFVEYLGKTPFAKVLDFMIVGKDFDYPLTEIAQGAGVGWTAFSRIWKVFVDKGIVKKTRDIGKARLYKLNTENPLVKKMVQLHWEIIKAETDKLFEKEGWAEEIQVRH
jgi:DNA-binding transcriptional ArsR family regulator